MNLLKKILFLYLTLEYKKIEQKLMGLNYKAIFL